MWKTKRHVIMNTLIRPILKVILFSKNNFKSKVYKLDDSRNYLILANHQTTWDPLLLYCSFKNLKYPVMAKDFIPHKYRRLVEKWVGPIYKAKTLKDLTAVKNMLQVCKEGNIIYLYPEGNRTFSGELCYIAESTIKLIQKVKVDIVFYNFHGGFGKDSRFSKVPSKGKFYGEIRKIVTREEINKMTFEELYRCVIENLTVIEAPSSTDYISSTRAEYLERVLYRCPICGEISTLHSKGNEISCSSCGLTVEYLPNLTFKANKKEFKHKTVADWYKEQETYVRDYQIENDACIYQDENTILHKLNLNTDDELLDQGKLIFTSSYIQIGNSKYNFDDIKEMTVSGKQTLIFYVDLDSYRISSSTEGFNCVKYLQMYYHIRNKQNNFNDDFLGI